MIKQLFLVSVISVLIMLVIMYFFQRHLIYFPAKLMPTRQLFAANDMQEVSLTTEDKLHLLAWYKPAHVGMPTLIYYHGNAGHIGYRMPFARYFLKEGYGVLLVEYRGYGGNQGRINEQGLYLDGKAAIKFMQAQGVPTKDLILYGESLGTGVATKISSQYQVCALILQSPYTSLTALSKTHYPWLPIGPWDKFDSLSRMKEIKIPLLILHGKQDRIVPYQQGLTLYQHANQPKELIDFVAKGHNDLWDRQFFGIINNFIRTYCNFKTS
ncbi:Bem46 protein [Legionella beliardensis]|uniref:Bem46 protein n=1 Tax=Legionella beliardensis TaxID=91822 RepID=A0A378I548_9GAMM|nr:alpha/beta hydrolase [Legionella beliardensis]STX27624.1 Bem46 protein [Legionella beliardensis]